MGVSKVVFGNQTLIDLTADTVAPENLLTGETAHGADGELVVGTAVAGGGGDNIYGAFINTNDSTFFNINDGTVAHATYSYTATKDCFADFLLQGNLSTSIYVKIDGKTIYNHLQTSIWLTDIVPLKRGQVISFENLTEYAYLTIYGTAQGTENIFAPMIYSDEERMIGVWRDGKPLYQKTITFRSSATAGVAADERLGVSVDYVHLLCGVLYNGWGNYLPLNLLTNNAENAGNLNIRNNSHATKPNTISFTTLYSEWLDKQIIATIQYTKTADLAGSGNWNTKGIPMMHYSTEEQVIGTWIDGATLYEEYNGDEDEDTSDVNDGENGE